MSDNKKNQDVAEQEKKSAGFGKPDDADDVRKAGQNAADADGSDDEASESADESVSGEEAKGEEQEESEGEGGELEKQEDNDARYMRLAADFQNYKRRTEKEKSDIYRYANEKIALDIAEVMDNFERALSQSECQDRKYAEGIELIYKQLKGVMDKNNIIEIDAEGKPFDPNFHNAVMTEDNPEFESGLVIQVLQKGYTLNEKVIRPSMVKVSQ